MIPKKRTAALFTGFLSAAILAATSWSSPAGAAEEVSYKPDVFPILQSRCVARHGPGGEGYNKSGLDLTSYEGLMKGTKFGPVVVPGDPLTSNLDVLIEGRAQLQMPHDQRPLLRRQQKIIRNWVKQGAENNRARVRKKAPERLLSAPGAWISRDGRRRPPVSGRPTRSCA